jgi:hypothetical protein
VAKSLEAKNSVDPQSFQAFRSDRRGVLKSRQIGQLMLGIVAAYLNAFACVYAGDEQEGRELVMWGWYMTSLVGKPPEG